MMKINILVLITALFFLSCEQPKEIFYHSKGKVEYPITRTDEMMLDSIQRVTFGYFLNEHHPEWGIVKDRADAWAPSSIASTGFAIPCFAIGVERNWIPRDEAAKIILNMLNFFMNAEQSNDSLAVGYKGFYYHFLRMDTGLREWSCELSTIDTGLLMMGIIFARNYFNRDDQIETQIRLLAGKLLSRLDWNFFEMAPDSKHPYTISMGWTPESGVFNWGWTGYNGHFFFMYWLPVRVWKM